MKIVSSFLLGILVAGTSSSAAPFDPARVAEDTKWLAHVDVEGLKSSDIGGYVVDQIKMAIASKGGAKVSIDIDGILQQIQSITAYGTAFDDNPENHSVLLVEAGPKAQTMVDGFLASQELANDGKVPFKTVTGKSFPTYLIANEVYMTFPRKDLIVISKQFDQVERAMSVLNGKLPSLKKKSPLVASANADGFFFIASANGLNALKNMPPQARLLQKATSMHFALGEKIKVGGKNKDLAAFITLQTADSDVASQMRKIVDGMLAMASFVQVQDQNFNRLVQSITVNESDRAVTIGWSYPAEEVVKLVTSLASEQRSTRSARAPSTSPTSQRPTRPAPPEEPAITDSIGGTQLKVSNVDARSDNGNLARNATDADPASYWAAKGAQQWIRCELESPSLLREIRIAWKDGDKKTFPFLLQTSSDGTQWKTLVAHTHDGTTDRLKSYNVPDTVTRWVRVMVPAMSKDGVTGISDLRFYGDGNVVAVASPEAPR